MMNNQSEEAKVLLAFESRSTTFRSLGTLAADSGQEVAETKAHLGRLRSAGFVDEAIRSEGVRYFLTHLGRQRLSELKNSASPELAEAMKAIDNLKTFSSLPIQEQQSLLASRGVPK